MTDTSFPPHRGENNVITIRPAKPSPEGWGQREQEALLIARLAAMPLLEYERARLAAAKELKCRVSWLDRKIEFIRCQLAEYRELPPARDGRTKVGEAITFWPDRGPPVIGFVTATAHRNGKDSHFLVLADGNGTCVRSTSLSAERAEELRRLLEESKN
jgi:hypothetical protein